jgi:hypothetical protein
MQWLQFTQRSRIIKSRWSLVLAQGHGPVSLNLEKNLGRGYSIKQHDIIPEDSLILYLFICLPKHFQPFSVCNKPSSGKHMITTLENNGRFNICKIFLNHMAHTKYCE